MPESMLQRFLKSESAGGILLMIAAALALILDNSSLSPIYRKLLELHAVAVVGTFTLEQSLLHWINDGLMAMFFLLVGLEIKREVLEGQLSSLRQIALPGLCALGGMAVPALVYLSLNWSSPETRGGWAIPAATDIAFAVGVMALLGRRVPPGLKLFLLALAIIDDLGAIVIIALFYTADLSWLALGLAAIGIACLVLLNRLGVTRLSIYAVVGVLIWVCVLKSGVHATLAGVAVAFAIPMKGRSGKRLEDSPLRRCEHALHPWVNFGIMPVFAFANAGVSLAGVGIETLLQPVTLGIALGLFIGKQAGVMALAGLGAALGVLRLPERTNWMQMYGAAVLTGIGFTMSLFIGTLAFSGPEAEAPLRLGVLSGSLLSAIVGYAVLRLAPAPTAG